MEGSTESGQLHETYTAGVFHSLDKRREGIGYGGLFVTGFFADDDRRIAEAGEQAICLNMRQVILKGAKLNGNDDCMEVTDWQGEWDYCTVTTQSPEIGEGTKTFAISGIGSPPETLSPPMFVDCWKGISGGGLWMGLVPDGGEEIQWDLKGIIYWQEGRDTPHTRHLRCHGIDGIVKHLRRNNS